ncbi:MAG: hypothetical protein ACTSRZ_14840, partial [Promethearchaeota archaeon]
MLQKNKSKVYEAEFPFIYNDIFLKAKVIDNKQKLIIYKKDLKNNEIIDKKELNCIHVAVQKLSLEEFKEKINNEDFKKEILNIRSSERLRKIKLSPEERFKAFRSWVAGIAEAGNNAIRLQYDIEHAANLQYPISSFLLKSLCALKKDFFYDFLEYIRRFCIKEGVLHKPCVTANAKLLLDNLFNSSDLQYMNFYSFKLWLEKKDNYEKVKQIIDLAPYVEIFLENQKFYFILSLKEAAKLEGFTNLILKRDFIIQSIIASNPSAPDFDQFKFLIKNDNHFLVRRAVASNPNAVKFKEYKNLFHDDEWEVRKAIAANPNTVKFEEYKNLFYDNKWEVRRAVAANPNAVKFEEYKNLFHDNEWEVRRGIASNPNAVKFEEY